jgi:Ribonuclease G/E
LTLDTRQVRARQHGIKFARQTTNIASRGSHAQSMPGFSSVLSMFAKDLTEQLDLSGSQQRVAAEKL